MEEGTDIEDGPYSIHGIIEEVDEGSILFIVKRVSFIIFPESMESHEKCWYQHLKHEA